MTPSDIVALLAAALRDVIQATPEECLEHDSDRFYADIACRLIVRLAPEAAIVPKASIKTSITDGYRQMRAVSDDVVRVLALFRREGYTLATIKLAVVDAYVRLRRVENPSATAADVLDRFSKELREMATDEGLMAKEGKH